MTMEKELLVFASNNQRIKDFSALLKKSGIDAGSDYYYEFDNGSGDPFFKIPKAYKKERDGDPDVHYIFVDVNDREYTVTGSFTHEHFANASDAISLVKGLYTGEIVEVAIVFPQQKAACFANNTGDPADNVAILANQAAANYIMAELSSPLVRQGGGHLHKYFEKTYPYNMMFVTAPQQRIEGVEIYLVSSVLAEHPEFYVVK